MTRLDNDQSQQTTAFGAKTDKHELDTDGAAVGQEFQESVWRGHVGQTRQHANGKKLRPASHEEAAGLGTLKGAQIQQPKATTEGPVS